MARIARIPSISPLSDVETPIRAAVLDLLALAAPRPAALGGPSAEEAEFLETLRRIVVRSASEGLWDETLPVANGCPARGSLRACG